SYGHSSGKIDTKTSFIDDLVNGKSDFVSITFADQTIAIADNVALVRHKLNGESKSADGKVSPINLHVLLVWQKQKGQWKFLARHAARINP
ncbi:MAG TPA: nuclear transport factor 2 family protein, partial [Cyclobacteriaceae bacterium]|nr:nuclear transport factor 2 family protein [Cyclobacteriaceae bacterium]